MQKSYQTQYQQTYDLIKKVMGESSGDTGVQVMNAVAGESASLSAIATAIQSTLANITPPRIIEGFDVVATTPASNQIMVNTDDITGKSKGVANGKYIEFEQNFYLDLSSYLGVSAKTVYVVLSSFDSSPKLSEVKSASSLILAKIIIPDKNTTRILNDKPETGSDGYIISGKDLLFEDQHVIDDYTIEIIKEKLSKLSADSIVRGSLTCTEFLKITNISGSAVLGSTALDFYDQNKSHLAHYGADGAWVGQIKITPDTLESKNFVSGQSGFQIHRNGKIKAVDCELSGNISASTIDIGGDDDTSFHVDIDGNMWLGSGTFASAPFSVTNAGVLKAISGAIGGWMIANNKIYTSNLLLESDTQRIQTADFQSGNKGWRLDPDVSEFNNAVVRGSLRCSVFVKDEIHATNGTLLITSALKLHTEVTSPSSTETSFDIICDDLETGAAQVFSVDDIIRCKAIYSSGVSDVWMKVNSYTDNGDGTGTYNVTLKSGTSQTLPAGSAVVKYGISSDGRILLTSDLSNSPYIDIFTVGNTPWTGVTTTTRIGNLTGISDADFGGSLTGEGIYTNRGYFKGKIVIASGDAQIAGTTISSIEDGADVTGNHQSDISLANLGEKDTSSLNQVADYKLVTDNEKAGANRAYGGFDVDSYITHVVQGAKLTSGSPATGLNLTGSYMGYYDGTGWPVFIQNDGKFKFQGDANNLIDWNISEANTLTIKGKVVIQGGSGLANLSDANADSIAETAAKKWAGETDADVTGNHQSDISLANLGEKDTSSLNQVADYKLVTDNEKAGANRAYGGFDVDSYITHVVQGAKLTSGSPATGLNLTGSYMGYYDGTGWPVFIQNDGKFKFQGDANNLIDWNISEANTLTIKGKVVIQGGSGLANLSDAGDLATLSVIGDAYITDLSVNKLTAGTITSKAVTLAVDPGAGDVFFNAGKCFGKGTKILMYDGSIKKVEDIVIGDLIMGDDSTPRKVLNLGRGQEEMYKITLNNGDSFVCNKSHILSLKRHYFHCRKKEMYITTKNISVANYLLSSDSFKHGYKAYKNSVEYPHKEVSIDPYFLGLWLGDGTSNSVAITTADKEIIDFLQGYAFELGLECRLDVLPNNNAKYVRITTGYQGGRHKWSLQKELRKLGVLGNKHIPEEYLVNDRETRMKLLAGLIDSDGNINNNNYEFCNKNESLIDAVRRLALSLGFYVGEKRIKIIKGAKYFRIRIGSDTFSELPIKIDRKIITKNGRVKNYSLYSFTVEPIGVGDYYGFNIDGNKLFLLPDCTVCHNTDFVNYWLIENCDDAWSESVDTDVTSTADTSDYKAGSASAKLEVVAGASAGDILATEAITSLDLSKASEVRLWIKCSVATASGDLQLLLDDTANCASPLETLDIPALSANTWTQVTLPLANPGSDTAIISVGLKYVTDLGACTIWIDDVKGVNDGFILGIDDSDSDRAKFYIGNDELYLNWDGTQLLLSVDAFTIPVGGQLKIKGDFSASAELVFDNSYNTKLYTETSGLDFIIDAYSDIICRIGQTNVSGRFQIYANYSGTSGASLCLVHNPSTPAIGDHPGQIYFKQSSTNYGSIVLETVNVTADTEEGKFKFSLIEGGSTNLAAEIIANGELHLDATLTENAWDDYNDLELAHDFSRHMAGKANEVISHNLHAFDRAGLITVNDDGHHFMKVKAMSKFSMFCHAETYKKLQETEKILQVLCQKQGITLEEAKQIAAN